MAKKFDRDLYNKCDPLGKNSSINLMTSFGYTLKDDTEVYKLRDFIMTKDGKDVWVEAEYSPSWKTKHWPSNWKSTCPARKQHSKAELYIRINADQTTALVIPMAKVLASPIIKKTTQYTVDEPFYHFSVDDCDVFDLSDPQQTNSRYF